MKKLNSIIFIFICSFLSGQNKNIDKIEFYLKKTDYTKVCDLASKIITSDSLNTNANFYYGLCQRKNGNYYLAFKYINQAILIDKNNSRAYAELGNIYAMTGDYNNALKNYDYAISINPTNAYPYNSKGALYYQFLNVDSLAILNFNIALSLDKNNILALYNIGIYAKYQEEYKEAIKYLSKAIKRNKGFQKAYEARACCYYYLNKSRKAIKGFKKALKYNTIKDPFDKLDDIELYKWLSKCYYKINNNEMGYYYFKLTEK